MPDSQNNNYSDTERRCESPCDITEKFTENERLYGEYKIVVNEPVNKTRTESNEVIIDKLSFKVLESEYKKEKIKLKRGR